MAFVIIISNSTIGLNNSRLAQHNFELNKPRKWYIKSFSFSLFGMKMNGKNGLRCVLRAQWNGWSYLQSCIYLWINRVATANSYSTFTMYSPNTPMKSRKSFYWIWNRKKKWSKKCTIIVYIITMQQNALDSCYTNSPIIIIIQHSTCIYCFERKSLRLLLLHFSITFPSRIFVEFFFCGFVPEVVHSFDSIA